MFACNEYNEEQKMKLAAAEFSAYALAWWNKYQRDRTRYEEPMVESWTEMKRIMRKRYIPASYNKDLQLKLQRMTQGNILIILESVSLLGFFPASCDLIKNPPILVAIILRLIKLCLWRLPLFRFLLLLFFNFLRFVTLNSQFFVVSSIWIHISWYSEQRFES